MSATATHEKHAPAPTRPVRTLSRRQKLAALLVMMGQDNAAQVLKSLPKEKLRGVTADMANLPPLERQQQVEIVAEFSRMAAQAMPIGGMEFLQTTLERALGAAKASELLQIITSGSPTDDSFAMQELIELETGQLFTMVGHEQPQLIALVISFLTPYKASELLMMLSPELREAVIERLAILESAPMEVADKLARVLLQQVAHQTGRSVQTTDGVRSAARVLNLMTKETSKSILESLNKRRAKLGDAIRMKMFTFDDLARLDGGTLQEILREIKPATLAMALKNADEGFKNALLKGLSKRAAENIHDEIALINKPKPKHIIAAQQEIIQVANKLEEEGKIELNENAGEAE